MSTHYTFPQGSFYAGVALPLEEVHDMILDGFFGGTLADTDLSPDQIAQGLTEASTEIGARRIFNIITDDVGAHGLSPEFKAESIRRIMENAAQHLEEFKNEQL